MKKALLSIILQLGLALALFAEGVLPECRFVAGEGGATGDFIVEMRGPDGAYVNQGSFVLLLSPGCQVVPPLPEELGVDLAMDVPVRFHLKGKLPPEWAMVCFQACEDKFCHMPQFFRWKSGKSAELRWDEAFPDSASDEYAQRVEEALEAYGKPRTISGYQNVEEFQRWLAGEGEADEENPLAEFFRRYGIWLTLLLMLPLGVMLNLTPCVLPMIPVTLGILGAGGAAASRRRGLLVGFVYGAGMAVSYGVLGIVAVQAGGRFGAINASPFFNLAAGLLFVLLGLAMFDCFSIDFSRWRPEVRSPSQLGGALMLGVVTALLGSACVAPVLLWVLLLAAELRAAGHAGGVWLPLALGCGMGLPWPFLCAGMSLFPRPGRWMAVLKRCMGAVIILAGVYYGVVAVRLWRNRSSVVASSGAPAAADDGFGGFDRDDQLLEALLEGRTYRKSVFIDFTGVSCKACELMDSTTLADEEVRSRLEKMLVVRIYADDFKDPAVAPILKRFQVVGLPTYVLLEPKP